MGGGNYISCKFVPLIRGGKRGWEGCFFEHETQRLFQPSMLVMVVTNLKGERCGLSHRLTDLTRDLDSAPIECVYCMGADTGGTGGTRPPPVRK